MSNRPNPYNPAQPTSDPSLFYGQEAAFAFIRQQAFAERRARAPLLIGRHGIGKTSILWQVTHRLDARTVAVYIDLAGIDLRDTDESGESAALWIALSDAARRALEAAGVSVYRLPELPADLQADAVRGWFAGEYLTVALAAMRQRRLLFLFDNAGVLLDRIGEPRGLPTLLDRIGELLLADERIKCLFALDLADAERAERHSLLSDPLLVYRVPYLADFEADALIREPAVFAYGLHTEAARAIRSLCGGFPYALHVVNALIFDRSAARGHASPITVDDVLAVLPDAIQAIDPICAPEWAGSGSTERRVLASLSALAESNAGRPVTREALFAHLIRTADAGLDETSLIVSLRRLEYQDVIRAYPDRGYVFAVALQQQWLLLYGHLPPPISPIVTSAPIRTAPPESIPVPAAAATPRRAGLPIGGLIGLVVLIAALIGIFTVSRNNNGSNSGGLFGGSDGSTALPTVTLDVNLQGTRLALIAAQTAIAQTIAARTAEFIATSANGTRIANTRIADTQAAARLTTIALTPTATFTPTITPTVTISATPSITLTPTDTASFTPSVPPSNTSTASPTAARSQTISPSPSASATSTCTPTATYTQSPTASAIGCRSPLGCRCSSRTRSATG